MAASSGSMCLSSSQNYEYNGNQLLLTFEMDGDDSDKDPDYVCRSSDDVESHGSDVGDEDKMNRRNSRKRKRGKTIQQKTKEQKVAGKCYRKYRGKGEVVQERSMGPDCHCRNKCFEKIPESHRKKLFRDFWDLKSHDVQNSYIRGRLRTKHVARQTKKVQSRRTQTLLYSILYEDNDICICKKAFLSFHGLSTSRGRIEYIVRNLKAGDVTPVNDKRGRHTSHIRKYNNEDVENVKNFIDKIPRYKSHYSRRDNYNREYLTLEYSIVSLYEQYKQLCATENINCVSSDKFRRIFNEEFNISFSSPKSDTCATCDSYNISLKEARRVGDENQIASITSLQQLHHRKAQAGQDSLKEAVQRSKVNSGVHVITFDLQQALPTPKLTTGPCFYKRKLWCYNLSVHCANTGQGYFFLWDEATAKRGADEIASGLNKYFEEYDIKGETLVAFSDNCCGQNKNWTIVGFWLHLLSKGLFRRIEHVFPQVGHTMLPSDRDFALVEKHVRTQEVAVYSPDDWCRILQKSQKKKPFFVKRMEREDFKLFSSLRGSFQQGRVTTEGQSFSISTAVKLVLDVDDPMTMLTYSSYFAEPNRVSLKKRGRPSGEKFPANDLLQKYSKPVAIDSMKLNDVMSCLQWIPPVYHQYYYSLKANSNVEKENVNEEASSISTTGLLNLH